METTLLEQALNGSKITYKINDMWWIISVVIWFAVGLVSTLIGVHVAMTERGGMTLSDCLVGLMWLLIGPLMWCAVGLQYLTNYVDENSTKIVLKAKKKNVD